MAEPNDFKLVREIVAQGGSHDILRGEGGNVLFPVPWAREPSISHLAASDAMQSLLTGAVSRLWTCKTRQEKFRSPATRPASCCGTPRPMRSMMPWCLWFPGPGSATGEDVAEVHVHGGRALLAAVFAALSATARSRANAGGASGTGRRARHDVLGIPRQAELGQTRKFPTARIESVGRRKPLTLVSARANPLLVPRPAPPE
jgi:hypothetical protein